MPVYNVEAYIEEAIQSVLDQTFEDFELIVVDDGGPDRSIALARAFSDPRIRIVSQANRGLAGRATRASPKPAPPISRCSIPTTAGTATSCCITMCTCRPIRMSASATRARG
jgi:cellulose synthase/poly-beta-1,6-N-acetylglucosamine synthase-like glycosyltransferase